MRPDIEEQSCGLLQVRHTHENVSAGAQDTMELIQRNRHLVSVEVLQRMRIPDGIN